MRRDHFLLFFFFYLSVDLSASGTLPCHYQNAHVVQVDPGGAETSGAWLFDDPQVPLSIIGLVPAAQHNRINYHNLPQAATRYYERDQYVFELGFFFIPSKRWL